uniref:Integrase catalytic domain-containing protein n=1 Tax=Photinus pyralis TaxID=7054 RepID=A0A1Y1N9N6_PHOPY
MAGDGDNEDAYVEELGQVTGSRGENAVNESINTVFPDSSNPDLTQLMIQQMATMTQLLSVMANNQAQAQALHTGPRDNVYHIMPDLNKIPGGKRPGQLHPIPPPSRPFARIHIDHVGPFIKSSAGNMYILVIVDALTKFVKLFAMSSTKTAPTVNAIELFMTQFGIPRRLISDRGTCFTSELFKDFIDRNGIQHILNSTQWPRANGQVERVNQTLVPVIMSAMDNETEWDIKIPEVERNLNITPNKVTRKTPFEALYGFLPRFTDGPLSNLVEEEDAEWRPPEDVQREIREKARRCNHATEDHL